MDDDHLHFLELFAGQHHLTDSMLEFGLKACAMDAPELNHIHKMFQGGTKLLICLQVFVYVRA